MLNRPPPAPAPPGGAAPGVVAPLAVPAPGAAAPKVNPPAPAPAPGIDGWLDAAAPNANGLAPPPGAAGVGAGAPNVNPPLLLAPPAGAPKLKLGVAAPPLTEPAVEAFDKLGPIALEAAAPNVNPPAAAGETGAGDAALAPKVNDGAADVPGAAEPEGTPPKPPNEGALDVAAPLAAGAPKLNEGVAVPDAAAGDGGAGDGDAEAPNVNVGGLLDAAVAEAPPKNELPPAAGALNGDAGGSFLSVEAPNVKPDEPAPNRDPAAGAADDDGAADVAPKENAGAAAGLPPSGSASSSMPLSPASSVTDAGAEGAERPLAPPPLAPPKRDVGSGAAVFFSSPCGVAGVVPKLNVGADEAEAEGAAEGAPNEKGEAGLSPSAGLATAPNANGESLAGAAASVLAGGPKPNADFTGVWRDGAESGSVAPGQNIRSSAYLVFLLARGGCRRRSERERRLRRLALARVLVLVPLARLLDQLGDGLAERSERVPTAGAAGRRRRRRVLLVRNSRGRRNHHLGRLQHLLARGRRRCRSEGKGRQGRGRSRGRILGLVRDDSAEKVGLGGAFG